jgi:L-threonylcarbamoyladenylate synthase
MRVNFEKACKLLEAGNVVAIPTETVYGLAASLSDPEAIEHIFTLKGRPADNPLIIHVADSSQVVFYTKDIPKGFEILASTFWPGPMTLVLPAVKEWVPSIVRADLNTVAFRIPSHPLTLQVLINVGPLVMPSANLSGKPSATRPEHVENDFGMDFPVLDGGECYRGVESTILMHNLNRWEIVRLGALTPEIFEPFLGYQPQINEFIGEEHPVCPGQLYRHYAPQATLILDKGVKPDSIGTIVGFSDRKYPDTCRVYNLGSTTNPEEVAKNLYETLRKLDREGVEKAWVDTVFPSTGLWTTVAERLRKASSRA